MNPRNPTVIGLAALMLATGAVHADSKKWRANNQSNATVKVFWTAQGCAGTKPACANNHHTNVCKTKILHPGESSDYRFKGGTSDKHKWVCNMDAKSKSLGTQDRKANEILCSSGNSKHTCWFENH